MTVFTGRVTAKQRGIPPAKADLLQSINAIPSLFVAGGDDAVVAPRVVHLGCDVPQWLGGEFPGTEHSYNAGMVLGNAWDEQSSLCAALELSYGVGSVMHTIFADWRPGSYQLPPCSSVRVSVRPWGYLWAESSIDEFFTSSITDGSVDGLHPLTLTASSTFAAGVTRQIRPPPHARACEIHVSGDTSDAGPIIVTHGYQRRLIDAPALFPVPSVQGSATPLHLQNAGEGEAKATLTFYLAP